MTNVRHFLQLSVLFTLFGASKQHQGFKFNHKQYFIQPYYQQLNLSHLIEFELPICYV